MSHIVWHDEFHISHEVLNRVFRLEAKCGNKQISSGGRVAGIASHTQ